MAMAMGIASLAVTAPKHTLATPCASANKGENRGEKQGFLDWFRTAMDKESLSEMDAVMAKGGDGKIKEEQSSNGIGNRRVTNLPKKDMAAPTKNSRFNFFGKK